MLIGGLQKLTLIDYPEKIACTIFLVGCNFHCGYCYNVDLVVSKEIKKQSLISEEQIFKFLNKRKGLLEAVVISGGEPTTNKELLSFIRKIKGLGYLIKLDTNGSNPESLENLINQKMIDYIAMDIKAPLNSKPSHRKVGPSYVGAIGRSDLPTQTKYEKIVGVKVNLEDIKKSIEIIKNSNIDYEFRTTLLLQLHKEEDIIKIAQTIQGARIYYLQNFKPGKIIDPYSYYLGYSPWARQDIEALQKKCNQYLKTKIRE